MSLRSWEAWGRGVNSKNRRVSLKKIRAPGGRTPTYYNARPRAGGRAVGPSCATQAFGERKRHRLFRVDGWSDNLNLIVAYYSVRLSRSSLFK